MKKLTLKEIHKVIEFEDKCGVNNLLQEIFSHEHRQSGLDIFIDNSNKNYIVVKGTTIWVEEEKK